MPLAAQPVGVDVVVEAVVGALDATRLRLCEMGLVPGTPVRVTRRAPWGDPLEIAVRGTRVVLRAADAAAFLVRRRSALDRGVDVGDRGGGAGG
jgi:Fe2+ transport system protein FeoA